MIWFVLEDVHGRLCCYTPTVLWSPARVKLFKAQYRKFGGRVAAVIRPKGGLSYENCKVAT